MSFSCVDRPAYHALLARLLSPLDEIHGIDVYLASVTAGDGQAVHNCKGEHGITPAGVGRLS